MKEKSNNNEQETPENAGPSIPNNNPVSKEFFESDDDEFGSDSTTGSGFSEAEREMHDGHNPGKPANPESDDDDNNVPDSPPSIH